MERPTGRADLDDLVPVRAVHSLGEAEVLRTVLIAEGIDAVVTGGGLRRPRAGEAIPAYHVCVRRGDLMRAEESLTSLLDENRGHADLERDPAD